MSATIRVELVYACSERQDLLTLELPAGSTLQQAIDASGLLARHPEIDLTKNRVGVFARLSKLDTLLSDRDRVEIYRPLIADPREMRKQRAADGKTMKKGVGEGA
jgi:hypothetical protein